MKTASQTPMEAKTAALESLGIRELEKVEGGIIGQSSIPGLKFPIGPTPQPIPPFRDVFAKHTIGRA